MAIGAKASDTITRARNQLVELGFLDVVTIGKFGSGQGDKDNASVFGISERWREYPHDRQRQDALPAGRNIYPEFSLSNPNHPIHQKPRKQAKRAMNVILCSS
jgi:hypothetical protein